MEKDIRGKRTAYIGGKLGFDGFMAMLGSAGAAKAAEGIGNATKKIDKVVDAGKTGNSVKHKVEDAANLAKQVEKNIVGFSKYSQRVKQVMNSWKEADIRSFNKLSMEEQNIYIKVIENEGKITSELQEIVLKNGGYLDGLEYRIKSPSSVFEKIYLRPETTPISEMRDIVRYTEIQDAGNLVETIQKTISDLNSQGYEVIKLKNTWVDDTNPYNGINAQVKSQNGQIFELQFHTPESFALKNSSEMHGLYEQARITTSSIEATILKNKMFDLSSTLEIPKNIKQIKNIKKINEV